MKSLKQYISEALIPATNEALVNHRIYNWHHKIKISINKEYKGNLDEQTLEKLISVLDSEVKEEIDKIIVEKFGDDCFIFGVQFNEPMQRFTKFKRLLSNIIINHIIPYDLFFKKKQSTKPYDSFEYIGEVVGSKALYVIINTDFDKNKTIIIK